MKMILTHSAMRFILSETSFKTQLLCVENTTTSYSVTKIQA